MANRYFNQFQWSLEKTPVHLWGQVAIGATGAPTLSAVNSKGIKTIVRNSAGRYTITLGSAAGVDNYVALLMAQVAVLNATASTGPGWQLISQAVTSTTAPTIVLQFYAADGTTAADLSNGATLYFKFELKNSNAQ